MDMHFKRSLRGLYVITPGAQPGLVAKVAAALEGGASLIQYRDLTDDVARRRSEGEALSVLCRDADVPLLIDHDVALAEAVGAAGVHLGADDDIAAARCRLGSDAIIGVSCYASPERARLMAVSGADYVSFGAFRPSPTKPAAGIASTSVLEATRDLGIPRVAIGGITADNGADLITAGADMLAVVSAVFGADDIRAAARRFHDLFVSVQASSA